MTTPTAGSAAPSAAPKAAAEAPLDPPPASEYFETFILKKPIGIRLHSSCRVTWVDTNSALFAKVFVGDLLVSADGHPVKKLDELNEILKKPGKHAGFSQCVFKTTTLERMWMEKDAKKVIGKAIQVYHVFLHIPTHLADDLKTILGLAVKYDTWERLQVATCSSDGIASLHLRPGDIIKKVNETPVMSKSALRFHIHESIFQRGFVRLTLESPVGGDDNRDYFELARDVQEIALKQIAEYAKASALPLKPILKKPSNNKKNVHFSAQERSEVDIAADVDPSKLKSCKKNKL